MNYHLFICSYRDTLIRVILIVIVSVLYGWRLWGSIHDAQRKVPLSRVTGTVETAPAKKNGNCYFTVENECILRRQCPQIEVGDLVTVIGKPQLRVTHNLYPEYCLIAKTIIPNNTYKDANYQSKLGMGPMVAIQHAIDRLHADLSSRVYQLFPPSTQGLVAGMLLGDKEVLTKAMIQKLQISGLIHMVVASGGNIAILTAVMMNIIGLYVYRKRAIVIVNIIVGFYLFLAGFDPPLVRAYVMTIVMGIGQLMGRKTSGLWVLCLTFMILLIIQPLLVFSLSFQLSAAATFGLLAFGNYFQLTIMRFAQKRFVSVPLSILGGDMSATMAAQLGVFPLILLISGSMNILSLLANILVTPLVAPIMIGSLLSVCLSYIWLPLGQISAWLLNPLLNYLVGVIDLFSYQAVIPLAAEIGWGWVISAWMVELGALWCLSRNIRKKAVIATK